MKRTKWWQASHLVIHADDLNAWLYSVNVGSINKTRYQIKPYDTEIMIIKGVSGTSVTLDSRSVISQLANWFSQRRKLSKAVSCTTTKNNHTDDQHTPMYKDQGTGGNCSSPCCTPFLEHTCMGASVRCNTTTTYNRLCSSSNETTMASMWDRTPHMPRHTFGKWSPSSRASSPQYRQLMRSTKCRKALSLSLTNEFGWLVNGIGGRIKTLPTLSKSSTNTRYLQNGWKMSLKGNLFAGWDQKKQNRIEHDSQ